MRADAREGKRRPVEHAWQGHRARVVWVRIGLQSHHGQLDNGSKTARAHESPKFSSFALAPPVPASTAPRRSWRANLRSVSNTWPSPMILWILQAADALGPPAITSAVTSCGQRDCRKATKSARMSSPPRPRLPSTAPPPPAPPAAAAAPPAAPCSLVRAAL